MMITDINLFGTLFVNISFSWIELTVMFGCSGKGAPTPNVYQTYGKRMANAWQTVFQTCAKCVLKLCQAYAKPMLNVF